MNRRFLGNIIRGSLLEGLEMKLSPDVPLEHIKAGKFIVVSGAQYDFFSIITDLRLATTNEQMLSNPPNFSNKLLREVISGSSTYAIISLRPMLMLERDAELRVPEPVKTIPSHFAAVEEANDDDIELVFGSEKLNRDSNKKYFYIGTPLDMEQPVCLDLEKFAERSSAVFGRTGTGKTFITRLLLAGFIHTDAAVNLVFDMHNEYGTKGIFEGEGQKNVKGLQPLFANRGKVKVYSLDKEGTVRRGAKCDHEVRISVAQIEPEDILLLQDELRLNPTAAEYAYHFIRGASDEQAAKEIASRYRIGKARAMQDFREFVDRIQALIHTPDLDPITYLDMERVAPHTQALTAPLRLDCALTYNLPPDADASDAPLKRVTRELTTDEWRTVLDKAWAAGVPHIIFTGGEPTLRPDLPDLITHAEKNGQVAGLLTDGLKLTDKAYLHTLLQTGLDHLLFILRPENEQSWRALGVIMPEDIFTTVHITLTPARVQTLPDILQRLVDSGVANISFTAPLHLQDALQPAQDLAAEHGLSLKWDLPVPYSASNPVAFETAQDAIPSGAGKAWLYIEPDGDVLPAQGVPDRVLGNILTSPWQDIYKH